MSVACLDDRSGHSVAFVIRDVSRAEAMRRPAGGGPADGVSGVMELVGSRR